MTNSSKRRSAPKTGARAGTPSPAVEARQVDSPEAGRAPAETSPPTTSPTKASPTATSPTKASATGTSLTEASATGTSLTGTAPTGSGRTLRWAVRVLRVEAAATALLTLVSIWAAVSTSHVSASSAFATPVLAAVATAILAGLAVALGRRRAFARGPAIVLEMLMLPMGYSMIAAGSAWLGVPTAILGLAGAVLLLAPSTRTALGLPNGA